MKIIDYFPVKNQGEREIGIEIEAEGSNLWPKSLNYWHIDSDGSLRGNPDSAEYVLRSPVRRSRVRSRLEYLTNALKKNNAVISPSDRCGVHIHMNVQTMDMEDLFKLCTLYYLFENVLTHWCGEDREGNLFCLRAKDAEALMEELINVKTSGNFSNLTTNSYRYSALNLAALQKYGSIEFRAMRTPEDFNQINTWVVLLLKLKDYIKTFNSEAELMKKVSTLGPLNLGREIFGVKFKHLDFSGFEDAVMDNLEIVQNLAFVPINKGLTESTISKKKSGSPEEEFNEEDLVTASRLFTEAGFAETPITLEQTAREIARRRRQLISITTITNNTLTTSNTTPSERDGAVLTWRTRYG